MRRWLSIKRSGVILVTFWCLIFRLLDYRSVSCMLPGGTGISPGCRTALWWPNSTRVGVSTWCVAVGISPAAATSSHRAPCWEIKLLLNNIIINNDKNQISISTTIIVRGFLFRCAKIYNWRKFKKANINGNRYKTESRRTFKKELGWKWVAKQLADMQQL